jgi:hypothetical protein
MDNNLGFLRYFKPIKFILQKLKYTNLWFMHNL